MWPEKKLLCIRNARSEMKRKHVWICWNSFVFFCALNGIRISFNEFEVYHFEYKLVHSYVWGMVQNLQQWVKTSSANCGVSQPASQHSGNNDTSWYKSTRFVCGWRWGGRGVRIENPCEIHQTNVSWFLSLTVGSCLKMHSFHIYTKKFDGANVVVRDHIS